LRTRPPPELKWLLVERPTLAGDLANLKACLTLLEAEIVRVQSTAQALDVVIDLTEARARARARARPDAARAIRRHQSKYGKRGALKEFVVKVLQQVDAGITSRELVQSARTCFGLEFVSEAEFNSYLRNRIRCQLQQLREQGLVETSSNSGAGAVRYVWKRGLPSLAELALLASAAASPRGAVDGIQDAA
jgi:hypothetical protein